jgi:hypothetical protein
MNIDTNRPVEQILEEIKDGAMWGLSRKLLNYVLPPLAALMVKLSKEAAETSSKNLRAQEHLRELLSEASDTADKTLLLTDRLYRATIYLVVLTVLLLLFTLGLFGFELDKHYYKGNPTNYGHEVNDKERPNEHSKQINVSESGLSLRTITELSGSVK